MKATGVCRNVDQLGRIVIPKELRHTLGMKIKDPIEYFLDGHQIILRKYQSTCEFCDARNNLIELHRKKVCSSCANELAALIRT
ncbi:AbrB/MazE/SpoVT family DNA-binding domain-containing protein [Sulfoacidibacillus ferrooxidans]|uniref:SpoVT-AbrB domain-containing protein n=1 Tax=Sulfoacidibacillus ferrooxidans TaxID=2005001 RepID=A0A9X2AER1_9BACL|nr:AbrB/MazE/SpoVT family DNA-binding domain-containing protein [Sulfoacidibacillus ferrooxidans]MCI0184855.1 hypothetical protein [Sulfoacidibacillus ferrooxidans]